ncbi:MAG: helicase-related protein [Candidatus Woesearchaeota archaeon]
MEPVLAVAKDTFSIDKQAIVFVNSKRSAESVAEKISKISEKELKDEPKAILKALSSPTRQCKRLSKIVSKGVAFHHSGLNYKQRQIIEDSFREGKINIICATPTLAAGLDMPAFRVIIRDLKRYTGFGMSYIPVLEFQQMIGRAGRPSFDTKGEAIVLVSSDKEKEFVISNFINGEPENIYSKLAVEPVLRTYVLSLICTGFVSSFDELLGFMKKTFYAHQYGDLQKLEFILRGVVNKLFEWNFLNDDFSATLLGNRVSELYLDPYTANFLIENIEEDFEDFGLIHLICSTHEMRPLINARKKDEELTHGRLSKDDLIYFDGDLNTVKTALVLDYWMSEYSEDFLYENLGVTPGELNSKVDSCDWLLYALVELCRIKGFKISGRLARLRVRVKNGVREELLPLLRFKGIGRVRARKLFNNKIKDVGDVKRAQLSDLKLLLGEKTALSLKEQV